MNYENIIGGFAEGLAEITEEIESVDGFVDIYNDDRIRAITHDLYAHFFLFLAEVLAWYNTSLPRRIIRSFNQKIYPNLEKRVRQVGRIATLLVRHAEFLHMEVMRDEIFSIRDQLSWRDKLFQKQLETWNWNVDKEVLDAACSLLMAMRDSWRPLPPEGWPRSECIFCCNLCSNLKMFYDL